MRLWRVRMRSTRCLLKGRGYITMKLRVKRCVSSTAVVFHTTPQSTLHSLKQQVIEAGLAQSETCELSLNRTEVLKENCTFQELGIVSGDLIYIIHHGNSNNNIPPAVETEEKILNKSLCGAASDTVSSSMESQSTTSNVCNGRQSTTTLRETSAVTSSSSSTTSSHVNDDDIESSSSSDHPPSSSSLCDRMNTQWTSFTHYHELCQHGSDIIISSQPHSTEVENRTITPSLTLCLALNSLMLDSGYSLVEGKYDASTARWRYKTAISDSLTIQLACVKMGPVLSVHAMTMVQQERLMVSLTLNISSYIENEETVVHCSLRKPNELAQVFKDNIANKLLTDIRKALGLPEVGTFSSLFPELKLLVCRRLDVKSLISLSSVNKELNILSQDNYLWKYLFYRDFKTGNGVPLRDGQCWKQLYIEQYKEREKQQRQFDVEFHLDRHWPILPPIPPLFHPIFPPGIRGGDYDLLPHVPLQPRQRPHPLQHRPHPLQHRPHPLQYIISQHRSHDIWNNQLQFPTRRSVNSHFRF